MDSEKESMKDDIRRKIITTILVLIPIIIIVVIILFRHNVVPSNEDIINGLKDTKYYTSQVDYLFKNSKAEFSEKTMQYYSLDKGGRIEFKDGYQRIKVYKGGDIKVEGNQEQEEFILEKDIDDLYPLAFIKNILSNQIIGDIKEVKAEWGDDYYLEVNIEYNTRNKHLNKAKFYVDKNKKVPVLLKILDDNNNERVVITYKDFVKEKNLSDDIF